MKKLFFISAFLLFSIFCKSQLTIGPYTGKIQTPLVGTFTPTPAPFQMGTFPDFGGITNMPYYSYGLDNSALQKLQKEVYDLKETIENLQANKSTEVLKWIYIIGLRSIRRDALRRFHFGYARALKKEIDVLTIRQFSYL